MGEETKLFDGLVVDALEAYVAAGELVFKPLDFGREHGARRRKSAAYI